MMRIWCLAVFIWLSAVCCGPKVALQDVEYLKKDSALVVKLLKEAVTQWGKENRMMYFGKKFLGLPYVVGTLGNGDKEQLIVNLHRLDCTTFVETVLALAICDKQRYAYVRGLLNYMSTHPQLYKQLKNHPAFVPVIKEYEDRTNGKQYPDIPKKNLNRHQSTPLGMVRDGDIVAMLTDQDGLDTCHIGIAFWKNGKLHLMHASSIYKKVLMSKETFYEYEAETA